MSPGSMFGAASGLNTFCDRGLTEWASLNGFRHRSMIWHELAKLMPLLQRLQAPGRGHY